MAIRSKTIEYAFDTRTTVLAATTRHDFSAITLYVPETTSRTFLSVTLQVTARDASTAASSTSFLLGIKLGGVAFNDVNTTVTLAGTSDQQSYLFNRDVTSYFNTNFGAGTSQTCQAAVTIGSVITNGHTAKLLITYEYDDSAASTRVKTVRIPIESPTAQLTASLTEIGTNQVPALDTFLPEASKVYRQIFFESVYNDGGNAVTDFNLELALDAEAGVARAILEQNQNTAVWGEDIWIRNDMTTNATHQFKARSTTASRFSLLATVLTVTYEYDHASSTAIMNSVVLPCGDEGGYVGGTASGDASRFERLIWIEEPATITMAQSGILGSVNHSAGITFRILAGSQAERTYNLTAGSIQAGPYQFIHRIDSGGAQGSAITLARGRNVLEIDWYSTVSLAGSNFSAKLYLNYTSGKHADGDGVHNHTTVWSMFTNNNQNSSDRRGSFAFVIPETDYYMTGLSVDAIGRMTGIAAAGIVVSAEVLAGEGAENGWEDLYNSIYVSDGEASCFLAYAVARKAFRRWSSDPDDERLNPETSRQYRLQCTATTNASLLGYLSYHSITFDVAGTVSGYTGDGSGITVEVFRSTSGEKVGSAVTTAGGGFTFKWFDDTEDLFCVARQDASHCGRSDNTTAT